MYLAAAWLLCQMGSAEFKRAESAVTHLAGGNMGIAARAYANADDVVLVWQCDRIEGCLGFAVQRKDASDGSSSYLPTYMPFAPDPAAPPPDPAAPQVNSQPSDVWPIQRYIWADYGAQRLPGAQYQVVPLLGEPGGSHPDLAQASPWTDPVTCGTGQDDGFQQFKTAISTESYGNSGLTCLSCSRYVIDARFRRSAAYARVHGLGAAARCAGAQGTILVAFSFGNRGLLSIPPKASASYSYRISARRADDGRANYHP